MQKLSAQTKSYLNQKGVISPMVIGGIVVVGVIVFFIASGSLKFSGYVKIDDKNKQQSQNTQTVPQATEEPKSQSKLITESYSNSTYGYSISYPEGWKLKEQSTNVNFFKPSEKKGGDQADALVSVVAGDLAEGKDMKLPTIGDLHKAFLKKQFTDVEILGEKEVKVNAADGYELEFTGSIGSEKMHGRYIVIKGEKYLYALIGMANLNSWDTEKGNIEASIQTFKIQ